MTATGGQVLINKGFSSFSAFWKSLQNARKKYGDGGAWVLHFRISTQAGVRPDCTHPFPLSPKMDDLRRLSCRADIGIAHNGIISMTSNYYNKTITYSDTMKFITDYLTLIIKNKDFKKDEDKVKLIERLSDGSRLCILDGDGGATLTGDWTEDGGVYYSNKSYKQTKAKKSYNVYGWLDEWDEWATVPTTDGKKGDTYEEYYNTSTGLYEFDPFDCPMTDSGTDCYCDFCKHRRDCYGDCDEVYGG
jgi:predicted glutamine amidotransferase